MPKCEKYSSGREDGARLVLVRTTLPPWNGRQFRVQLAERGLRMYDFIVRLRSRLGREAPSIATIYRRWPRGGPKTPSERKATDAVLRR